MVRPARAPGAVGVAGADEEIEGEEAVDAGRVRPVRQRRAVGRDAQVADDRTGLLRQPGLVEATHGAPAEHRRRAEDLADRDHAGAADAGQADDELVGRHGGHRIGQAVGRVADRRPGGRRRRGTGCSAAVDGHEGERRAVTLETGHVEVAARLVDAGLAAVVRHHRLHGEAVALVAAVPAALADPFVDDDPEVRLGQLAPAAGTTLLGGAGLVVDEHGHAGDGGERFLGLDQPGAVPHGDPRRRAGRSRRRRSPARSSVVTMTRWTPSRSSSCTTLGHVHLALRVLAARHRHGAVVEQFEGDVDAGGDGGTYGERAGVEVRAVAEVLDDVLAVDERRHPDPLSALVAHRREPGDVADPLGLHQGDHRVAADAAADERARRDPGRDVVRAATAVERRAVDGQRDARRLGPHRQRSDPCLVETPDEAGAQRGEQLVGVDRSGARDERLRAPRRGVRPPSVARPSVYSAPLTSSSSVGFFSSTTSTSVSPWANWRTCVLVERHRHRQPHQADAGAAQRLVVGEAEQAQRLAQLVVGLPAGGDAEPVVGGADGDLVELVEHAVLAGELGADLLELALHVERVRA